MSGTRGIKRSVDLAARVANRGKPGGLCPKCDREPLALIDAALPATLAICADGCGWHDPALIRMLVLIRHPGETDAADGVIVATDTVENAVRRLIRLGLLDRNDEIVPAQIRPNAVIPLDHFDRILSSDEMQALSDSAAQEPVQA